MNSIQLKALQESNYTELERKSLCDVSNILDKRDSLLERVEKFIGEVKNPYSMKCGNTIVEVTFSNSAKTIDSQIKMYLKSYTTD